jgi:hypothetical protein
MKIYTDNTDGAVTLIPDTIIPTPRNWRTIREVESLPAGEGKLQWVPADPEHPEAPEGELVRVPIVVPVPQSLTPRQFRLALIDHGITPDMVAEVISGIEDEVERLKAETEWDYASTIRRDHPMIATIGTALGKTPAQIDAIFLSGHSSYAD